MPASSRRIALPFIVALSALLPAALHAQDVACSAVPTPYLPGGGEPAGGAVSVIARARAAAELRDSLLVLQTSELSVGKGITAFLTDPYTNPPVSLDDLRRCQTAVNIQIRRQRKEDPDAMNPRAGMGLTPEVAAAAGIASGGVATAGLSTLNFAVGVTDFLVERAKDEAAYSLVLTVRRHVRSDDFLEAALPRSAELMEQIETRTFQSLMPLLRSSFVEDLNHLPTRDTAIIRVLKLTGEQRTYLQGISIAYARGLEMRRGTAPPVAIASLADVTAGQMDDPGILRALHVVGLLAREYAAGGGEPVIRELVKADAVSLRRYFVAFLAHDVRAMDIADATEGLRFLAMMRARETDAMLLLNQLHSLRETAAASKDDALGSVGAVMAVLGVAPRFAMDAAGGANDAAARLAELVDEAKRLHQALTDRDFSAVVTWLVQSDHLPVCRSGEASCETRVRVLSLAAALAAAQSSEEVTTALRTASAPVGSYRTKRSQQGEWLAPRTVSVLGYLGGGWHDASGDADDFAGVTLPVGIEASLGIPLGAVSLFFPLVDLGPLANQALGLGPDEEEEGEYDLRQVVAPGAAIVVNLTRNYPVSLGLGVQSVRRVTGTGEEAVAERTTRTLFFVGVDATLFQFRL